VRTIRSARLYRASTSRWRPDFLVDIDAQSIISMICFRQEAPVTKLFAAVAGFIHYSAHSTVYYDIHSMLATLRALSRTPPLWRPMPARCTTTINTSLLLHSRPFHASPSVARTLNQSVRNKPKPKKRFKINAPLLENGPQRKAVVSQIFVMKPKKPNSAKRKVARVKLSTGKQTMAYIQGEGHNLQEHSVVLVRGGRTQDLPGVRYKLVRGAVDFGGVVNRTKKRSKYGAKKPKK